MSAEQPIGITAEMRAALVDHAARMIQGEPIGVGYGSATVSYAEALAMVKKLFDAGVLAFPQEHLYEDEPELLISALRAQATWVEGVNSGRPSRTMREAADKLEMIKKAR